jgi:hypothetical protein
MYTQRKSAVIRIIAFLLVMVLVSPMGASALVQPRASAYLDSYNAYVYLPGTGEVRVYFNVQGTNIMDELGALSIAIYESTDGTNWTWKKTFTHDSTSGMLGYGDFYHSGYVSYNGVAGRYYKAYVCIWGGKNGQGDTRYFWTSAKH